MNLVGLRNLRFRAMVEAANDDDEKKKQEEEEKKKKEQEQEDTPEEPEEPEVEEPTEEENPDEQTEDEAPDDTAETDPEAEDAPPDEEGGEGNPPAEGDAPAEGEGDEFGGDDFGMDPDGGEEEDLGPAPDGLPEADDDGSGDEDNQPEDDEEMNIQVNILKLSALDRALAKKTVFQYFMDLKAKAQANLAIIDKNETVIDPDIREKITDKLNTFLSQLDQYLEYKLPIANFEEGLQSYFVFVKDINTALEEVKNDGIVDGKRKHKNKESS